MKQFGLKFSRLYSLPNIFKNNLVFVNKFRFSATARVHPNSKQENQEIHIKSDEKNFYYPVRGFPKFQNGLYTVFKYEPDANRVPLVPYEIKEHAMKGFVYTFMLSWVGRLIANNLAGALTIGTMLPLLTAGVFSYHYGRSMYYMSSAITSIELMENGTHVVLNFKNIRRPITVEISKISKKKDCERIIQESFAEPYLLPVVVDEEDKFGKSSLRSKSHLYIYGDSHSSIKDGEILRAILNSQPIKLN